MKYMGSKGRIAKEILPIMLKGRGERAWVEPFVGGANVIDKVQGKRIGGDKNEYIIALFKALISGWLPPKYVSENEYNDIKNNFNGHEKHLIGYVGFNSYGGKFFRGYRRDNKGKRDYWKEHFGNLQKQVEFIKNVDFFCCDYTELEIPKNSIIYCDIPYCETEKYKINGVYEIFDYKLFWNWCRDKANKEHTIFVSEYNAPADFECIWSREISSNLTNNHKDKKAVEKLFKFSPSNK